MGEILVGSSAEYDEGASGASQQSAELEPASEGFTFSQVIDDLKKTYPFYEQNQFLGKQNITVYELQERISIAIQRFQRLGLQRETSYENKVYRALFAPLETDTYKWEWDFNGMYTPDFIPGRRIAVDYFVFSDAPNEILLKPYFELNRYNVANLAYYRRIKNNVTFLRRLLRHA